jgi:bifunctional DNA-binding transcriptional regulator/antitoxin component of YhaV-PrlF toxin-antitoxin module
MKTMITMTSKGQITLPLHIRQKLGVNHKGARLAVQYDPKTKRYFLEKPLDIDTLHRMNQETLARNNVSLIDYKSGDGFRAHVANRETEEI